MYSLGILIGRVTYKNKKLLADGSEMGIISISTSKKTKDAFGNSKIKTTYHRVACFKRLADIVDEFIKVGDMVCVQGEIQNKKIEHGPKTGQFIYSINATDIKFIPNNNIFRKSKDDFEELENYI